ncbi:hypothetical protein PYW08_010396 [Mythimna loreyi]|uniref:Uncharacterized protein n=1 Tax=Mythimna loreyi TaxID=667449 RepID=A0ACC2Q513_9NEOP|nr:hypothetical protein PYW08_010396 [Mythimna loreyi]
MGMINSKDFRKIDEATSNTSLSNLRYVITEKPKWKVFKKKEVVPLPAYRSTKGCPCGNDGPCKQKVTPKGVTIHYPQKKKKFPFGLKPPKVQKSYFSRLAWKVLSSALPFQTSIKTNINISLPVLPFHKVAHAFRAVKSMGSKLYSVRSTIKGFKPKPKKPNARRVCSADFMFFGFR